MDTNEISFENLPKAIAHLVKEIAEIKLLIQNVQVYESKEKSIPVGIEEASRLIGKAKPTIYALVRQRKIPCYKYGKKLYFFEEEKVNTNTNQQCTAAKANYFFEFE